MTKPAPSFVYFVATPKRLLGSGAVPALADLLRAPMFQAIDNGPDGRAGVLVSESDCPSVRAVYRTDAGMRWEPWGDTPAGPAWVGMWDDWRPGPDALARGRRCEFDASPVVMGDGAEWRVPRLCYATGIACGPMALGVNVEP